MTLKAYPSYRDSLIGRGATLPTHWGEGKIKRYFDVTLGKMLESTGDADDAMGSEKRAYLRSASVQDGALNLDDAKKMWFSKEEVTQLSLKKGDLVVCEGGDVGRCAILPADLPDFGFQNSVHRVRPKRGVTASAAFLFYCLKASKASGLMDALCNKSTIAHLTVDKLKNLAIPYPDLPEQDGIVRFLNHHTGKIDKLILETERLAKLLQEKRRSAIYHAFTAETGLGEITQGGPMSCLGEAPTSWTTARLGYYAKVENGCTPSRDEPDFWANGSIPWVSSGEVNQYYVETPTDFITPAALAASSLRLLPKYSILVGLIGQGRTRGMSAMLKIEATINQNVAAVVPGPQLVPRFLHLFLEASYGALRDAARGGNQAALNCEILRAIRVTFPGFDEQAALVSRLDAVLEPLTKAAAECRRSVELLTEKRSALILAAVTGKFDVRRHVTALQEAA